MSVSDEEFVLVPFPRITAELDHVRADTELTVESLRGLFPSIVYQPGILASLPEQDAAVITAVTGIARRFEEVLLELDTVNRTVNQAARARRATRGGLLLPARQEGRSEDGGDNTGDDPGDGVDDAGA